ncbi:MAG: hypothetical protein K9J37_05360 [Saprospiraceae bacterium]|nr:hypothetical protein [Saprospiraceae bacterium]MCF8249317.1 hypothetical protein [Saprospiraceae bacterium]MCF8279738.1 hypothetical protein [Bacteroidales bacterium]MCF8311406.1 hypothetical protein [Saprospiraceae bacterium]MCF8439936.1 hypothetical protein [Saprospiraceae bacterium]
MHKNQKSGNGTSRRQWLYLYLHVPFLFLVKLGISGNYKRRARQVGRQSFGWAVPIFAVRIPFAWQCEQTMHRLFRVFNIHFGGSKEWYLFPIVPFAILIMTVAFLMEWLLLSMVVVAVLWWLN